MMRWTKSSDPEKIVWFIILVIGLGIVGCSRSSEIAYYQLSTMNRETGDRAADTTANTVQSPVIGVGPVRLPEYLERPQIMTRFGANRLQHADGHRWAEPLADNMTWVLKENLALLLGNNRLESYPWPRSLTVDRQLIIDIIHFEGDGNKAQLVAVWTIRNGQGELLSPSTRSIFQVPYSSLDYAGLTGALSETLSLFCREVAEGFRSQSD